MSIHTPNVSEHTIQVTKTFAQGASLGLIAIVSAISLATLVYVWWLMS